MFNITTRKLITYYGYCHLLDGTTLFSRADSNKLWLIVNNDITILWLVPNSVTISSILLKQQAVKHSGPFFWHTQYKTVSNISSNNHSVPSLQLLVAYTQFLYTNKNANSFTQQHTASNLPYNLYFTIAYMIWYHNYRKNYHSVTGTIYESFFTTNHTIYLALSLFNIHELILFTLLLYSNLQSFILP